MYPLKRTILNDFYAINILYGTILLVCIWCVCT